MQAHSHYGSYDLGCITKQSFKEAWVQWFGEKLPLCQIEKEREGVGAMKEINPAKMNSCKGEAKMPRGTD